MARMLRQLGTGNLFIYTDILAKRKDMVEEADPAIIKVRLEASEKRLAELKTKPTAPVVTEEAIKDSVRLAEVEKEISDIENKRIAETKGLKLEEPAKSSEEKEAARKQEIVDNDPEIVKIKAMTEKDDIETYVKIEYGEEIDKRQKLEALKDRAIALRTERLFEI